MGSLKGDVPARRWDSLTIIWHGEAETWTPGDEVPAVVFAGVFRDDGTTWAGETATVEFVGILGYYVLISMILNVFRMPLPDG